MRRTSSNTQANGVSGHGQLNATGEGEVGNVDGLYVNGNVKVEAEDVADGSLGADAQDMHVDMAEPQAAGPMA
jgi:hypothetical protein